MLRKTLIFGFLLVLGFSFQIDAVDSDNSPKQILLAFKSLENIPADASHGDIATLAKKRFGSHPQVDDWTQLCFRIRRDGHASLPMLKRFAELQIQMLTDVDAEKHAQQILAYQGALEEIEVYNQMFGQMFGKTAAKNHLQLPFDANTTPIPKGAHTFIFTPPSALGRAAAIDKWNSAALKHLMKFNTLKKSDPAARDELLEIAKIRFGTHILANEWIPLYFRLARDGKGRISDIKRFAELEIRILTDIDAEKHAEQIQQHRHTIEKYEKQVQTLIVKPEYK